MLAPILIPRANVMLLLFHIDLNIYAFAGMIMPIGIVEHNAIVQVDFALRSSTRACRPSRHLVRYQPAGVAPGGWHSITVRVTRPGQYAVEARRGYFGG